MRNSEEQKREGAPQEAQASPPSTSQTHCTEAAVDPRVLQAQQRLAQANQIRGQAEDANQANWMANFQSARQSQNVEDAKKGVKAAEKNLQTVKRQVAQEKRRQTAQEQIQIQEANIPQEARAESTAPLNAEEIAVEQASQIFPEENKEEANPQQGGETRAASGESLTEEAWQRFIKGSKEPWAPYSMEDLWENARTFDSSSKPQKIHRFRDLFAFEQSDDYEAEIAFEQSDERENYQLVEQSDDKAESYQLVDPATAAPTPAGFAYGRGVLFLSSVVLISVIVKNFFFKPKAKQAVVDRKENEIPQKEGEEK